MSPRIAAAFFVVLLATPLARADDLLLVDGLRFTLLDTDTGVTQDLGPAPPEGSDAMAICPSGRILVGCGFQLYFVDPLTYAVSEPVVMPFGPKGIACAPDGTGYALRAGDLGPSPDPVSLFRFDAETGTDFEFIGDTDSSTLTALAMGPEGRLYTWDISAVGLFAERGLHRVDTETAELTYIGDAVGLDNVNQPQWLDFDPQGRLFGGRFAVYEFDLETVAPTLVAEGFDDVRGAAFLPLQAECFLVIGNTPGQAPFQPTAWGHAFATQVDGVDDWYPVLMEDIPEFVIPDLLPAGGTMTVGRGAGGASGGASGSVDDDVGALHVEPVGHVPVEFTVQVLMWNPQVFPSLPEQSTHGLAVRLFPNGRVVTVPYGESVGGMNIWAETDVYEAGQRVIRFPFDIPLL